MKAINFVEFYVLQKPSLLGITCFWIQHCYTVYHYIIDVLNIEVFKWHMIFRPMSTKHLCHISKHQTEVELIITANINLCSL